MSPSALVDNGDPIGRRRRLVSISTAPAGRGGELLRRWAADQCLARRGALRSSHAAPAGRPLPPPPCAVRANRARTRPTPATFAEDQRHPPPKRTLTATAIRPSTAQPTTTVPRLGSPSDASDWQPRLAELVLLVGERRWRPQRSNVTRDGALDRVALPAEEAGHCSWSVAFGPKRSTAPP